MPRSARFRFTILDVMVLDVAVAIAVIPTGCLALYLVGDKLRRCPGGLPRLGSPPTSRRAHRRGWTHGRLLHLLARRRDLSATDHLPDRGTKPRPRGLDHRRPGGSARRVRRRR